MVVGQDGGTQPQYVFQRCRGMDNTIGTRKSFYVLSLYKLEVRDVL